MASTMAKLRTRIIRRLSPVSAARANGVVWRTGYAAWVRSWLAILVTVVGCKTHDLQEMTAIKAEVCACKTASCADQAMARVPKGSIASTPRIQALAREMVDCTARLQAAERPDTDPDAEGSAAEPAPGEGTAAPAPIRPR
jgi:hypothetical protein